MPVSNPGTQPVAEGLAGDIVTWVRNIAHTLNQVIKGKLNASVSVTLAANATSTTLTDSRIGGFSAIELVPQTFNAVAELASGNLYISNLLSGSAGAGGSCTINHSNNAQTDRTFLAVIIG